MMGLNTCTRLRAIMARRNRRISSSLLPENIGPQITSIQPRLPVKNSIRQYTSVEALSTRARPQTLAPYDWTMAKATHRSITPELLDCAGPNGARRSLQDLIKINRYFGGYRTLHWIMGQLVQPAHAFSLLDVGAASGDMGAA